MPKTSVENVDDNPNNYEIYVRRTLNMRMVEKLRLLAAENPMAFRKLFLYIQYQLYKGVTTFQSVSGTIENFVRDNPSVLKGRSGEYIIQPNRDQRLRVMNALKVREFLDLHAQYSREQSFDIFHYCASVPVEVLLNDLWNGGYHISSAKGVILKFQSDVIEALDSADPKLIRKLIVSLYPKLETEFIKASEYINDEF
jgi:hypothetical protein